MRLLRRRLKPCRSNDVANDSLGKKKNKKKKTHSRRGKKLKRVGRRRRKETRFTYQGDRKSHIEMKGKTIGFQESIQTRERQ